MPADARAALHEAGAALEFFAAAYGHLPCPAESRSGAGDCSSKTARWLPLSALGRDGDRLQRDEWPITYRIQGDRAASALAGDFAGGFAGRTAGVQFCSGLKSFLSGVTDPSARVGDDVVTPSAMTFLAVLGLTHSEAVFQQNVDAADLFAALECEASLASVDSLAHAAVLAEEAMDLQHGNVRKAAHVTNVMRMNILHRALEVVLADIDLAAGLYTLIDNQTRLAAAIAAAIAGIPPPPEAIPGFIAGIASAQTALTLNALDIPRSSVGLGLDSATLRRYQEVAGRALEVPVGKGAREVLRQARGEPPV